jgi:hypothetical protein
MRTPPGARFFAGAAAAVPAFFAGLFWSARYGPSTTEADLTIGLGCAALAAFIGIATFQATVRRVSPRCARLAEAGAWLTGAAMLVLFAVVVLH